MTDHIEPIPYLVALSLIVALWLTLGILDRRRARRVEAVRLIEACSDRIRLLGLCSHLWRGVNGWWVVCARPHEHTGPHVSYGGDMDRDG